MRKLHSFPEFHTTDLRGILFRIFLQDYVSSPVISDNIKSVEIEC